MPDTPPNDSVRNPARRAAVGDRDADAAAATLPVFGQSGTVAGHVAAAEWASRGAVVTLTLADGRHVFVERGRLHDAGEGHLSFGDAPTATPAATQTASSAASSSPAAEPPQRPSAAPPRESPATPRLAAGGDTGELEDGHVLAMGEVATLPVIEEQPQIGKRRVKRAVVRVHRRVREEQKQLDVPLMSQEVTVERVPADRVVDAMEPPRTEGDVTIIPVYEEVLVVQRKFRVREEIRLTRVETRRASHHSVTLRRHEVEVERVAIKGDGGE